MTCVVSINRKAASMASVHTLSHYALQDRFRTNFEGTVVKSYWYVGCATCGRWWCHNGMKKIGEASWLKGIKWRGLHWVIESKIRLFSVLNKKELCFEVKPLKKTNHYYSGFPGRSSGNSGISQMGTVRDQLT